jgi:hypothetical protein
MKNLLLLFSVFFFISCAKSDRAQVCNRTEQIKNRLERLTYKSCEKITLEDLKSIKKLNLSDEKISSLKAGDFIGLASLENLDLSSNQITTLSSQYWEGLEMLQILCLDDNPKIQEIHEGTFNGLSNVYQIWLQNMSIKFLKGAFSGMPVLEVVFSDKKTTIPQEAFEPLSQKVEVVYDNTSRSCKSPRYELNKPKPSHPPLKNLLLEAERTSRPVIVANLENLTVQGDLTKDEISKVIKSHMGQIPYYCYERQIQHQPNFKGKVDIIFTILGRSAFVGSASVSSSTLNSPAVEECITKAFKKLSPFSTAKSNTQGTAQFSFDVQKIQKKVAQATTNTKKFFKF